MCGTLLFVGLSRLIIPAHGHSFHNLSDVVSLYIAFWCASLFWRDLPLAFKFIVFMIFVPLLTCRAVQASKRESSDQMSYGWVRSEILGGLTNGCFLLSLCLYVALESIPRFIEPPGILASSRGSLVSRF